MAKLASMELNADQDVARGNKIPLNRLFSSAGMWQECQLLEDVQSEKTKIDITIAKTSGSFRTKANTTRKKGESTNCSLLLMRDDFTRKVAASEDIKKGDKLMVILNTL